MTNITKGYLQALCGQFDLSVSETEEGTTLSGSEEGLVAAKEKIESEHGLALRLTVWPQTQLDLPSVG